MAGGTSYHASLAPHERIGTIRLADWYRGATDEMEVGLTLGELWGTRRSNLIPSVK